MTELAVTAGVAIVTIALVAALVTHHQRQLIRELRADMADERHAWRKERHELTSRIQAPMMLPPPVPDQRPDGEQAASEQIEEDEWELVGTVTHPKDGDE